MCHVHPKNKISKPCVCLRLIPPLLKSKSEAEIARLDSDVYIPNAVLSSTMDVCAPPPSYRNRQAGFGSPKQY